MCSRFSLRFLVIQDRFNCETGSNRTVEDIKERYFQLSKSLGVDAQFTYDKTVDLKRKEYLQTLHSRNWEAAAEEAFVMDYLSKLQQSGELNARLSERIATIKLIAGEQFTAGWPTLPELLKIAAGKGGNRFIDRSAQKKKKKKRPADVASSSESSPQKKSSQQKSGSSQPTKKIKSSSSTPASACNIYLRSSKMQPLRVGSARAVEKILFDYGLPLKPDTPTAAVVEKFDRVRSAIIQLLDLRKAAGKPGDGTSV